MPKSMRGTKPLAPMSNFHRLLTMLSLNGGSLFPAQIYAARGSKKDNHTYIDIGKMSRKMSMVSPMSPYEYHYEQRAAKMGLVSIQSFNNRKWITLLPKGRAVLKMLDAGVSWDQNTKTEKEYAR